MVQSQIKSEINYPEIRTIDVADQGQAVDAFLINLHHHNYLVALGKEKYDFSTKHRVVYFPIYLLSPDASSVKARIGVLESKTEDLVSAYDDLDQLEPNSASDPLWFEFVTAAFLKRSGAQLSAAVLDALLDE